MVVFVMFVIGWCIVVSFGYIIVDVEVLLNFIIERLFGIIRLWWCVIDIMVDVMLLLLVKIVVGGVFMFNNCFVVFSLEWYVK